MGKVIALVQANEARVMGKDGTLPWGVAEYKKLVAAKTERQILIMGLGAWKLLGGKQLENRTTIVLTENIEAFFDAHPETAGAPKFLLAETFGDAISFLQRGGNVLNTWVLPGPTLFGKAYAYFDKVVVNEVKGTAEGDVYLPKFEADFVGDEGAGTGIDGLKVYTRKKPDPSETKVYRADVGA